MKEATMVCRIIMVWMVYIVVGADAFVADRVSDEEIIKRTGEYVNLPVERLAPEHLERNRRYLERMLAGKDKRESLRILLGLLKDRRRMYLPRMKLVEMGEDAIPHLRKMLMDPANRKEWCMRVEVLKTLYELGDKGVHKLMEKDVQPVLPAYDPARSAFNRMYIRFRVRGKEGKERVKELLRILVDKRLYEVRNILEEMGKQVGGELVSALKGRAKPEFVQCEVLWVLRKIGYKEALPLAMGILEDESATDIVKKYAADFVKEWGNEKCIPRLEKIIEKESIGRKGNKTVDITRELQQAIDEIRGRNLKKR